MSGARFFFLEKGGHNGAILNAQSPSVGDEEIL